jgi:hypothetical protein
LTPFLHLETVTSHPPSTEIPFFVEKAFPAFWAPCVPNFLPLLWLLHPANSTKIICPDRVAAPDHPENQQAGVIILTNNYIPRFGQYHFWVFIHAGFLP